MYIVSENKEQKFREYFNKMFPAICSFSYSYIKNYEAAKDIAQETFIKLYTNWNTLKNNESYKPFVYVTAKNLSLDYIKHQNIVQKHKESPSEMFEDEYFFHELTKNESIRLVNQAISTLPDQSRNIIRHCVEGLSNIEISVKLNISVNTVKTLKKNAYKKLREYLSSDYQL